MSAARESEAPPPLDGTGHPGPRKAGDRPAGIPASRAWAIIPAAAVLNVVALAVTTATRSVGAFFVCALAMAAAGVYVLYAVPRIETDGESDDRLRVLIPALVFTAAVQAYAIAFLATVDAAAPYPAVFGKEPLEGAASAGGQIVAALAIAFVLERSRERSPVRRAPVQLHVSGLACIVVGALAAMVILMPVWGPAVYATAFGVMVAAILASFALIIGLGWAAVSG